MNAFRLTILLLSLLAWTAPAVHAQTDDYVLRSEDRLQFRIAEDPIPDRNPISVVVNSVGEASFPVSRDSDIRVNLRVRGKTLAEVRDELKRQLQQEFYHQATITLMLDDKKFSPGKAIFLGEVQGIVAIVPDEPAKMLAETVMSLRPSDYADLKRVKLHREDAQTKATETRIIDVRRIIKENMREEDVELQDGDRIEVPAKWIN
ncbi:MAG: polysaccharide biosynthesis/export family protein [Limisphaerales bacterium]